MHGVFEIGRAQSRAPAKFGRIWHHGEGFHRALQERCEARKGGLSELVLCEIVVRLQPLYPTTRFNLVPASRGIDVVVEGEKIACGRVVRAYVGARTSDLRGAIRGRAARNHDGPDWSTGDPARNI